jgi:hypothetical protein
MLSVIFIVLPSSFVFAYGDTAKHKKVYHIWEEKRSIFQYANDISGNIEKVRKNDEKFANSRKFRLRGRFIYAIITRQPARRAVGRPAESRRERRQND